MEVQERRGVLAVAVEDGQVEALETEVAVEDRLRDTGVGGDVLELSLLVSGGAESVHRRAEDQLAALGGGQAGLRRAFASSRYL